MGMTVFLGQKIGERKASEGGKIVANGIMHNVNRNKRHWTFGTNAFL